MIGLDWILVINLLFQIAKYIYENEKINAPWKPWKGIPLVAT